MSYSFLLHPESFSAAAAYLLCLRGGALPGKYLEHQLLGVDLAQLSTEGLLESLVRSKRLRIFAESEVRGDGSDWNQSELALLGDLSLAAEVSIYDDGRHAAPRVHPVPFPATLLFVPGALLRCDLHHQAADWAAVTQAGRLDFRRFFQLYRRRLLPGLLFADEWGKRRKQQLLITIPGLGCGQFGGPFKGQLGPHLQRALMQILQRYRFAWIKVIYFDPYGECQPERHLLGGVDFRVRPFTKLQHGKAQLCQPQDYAEPGDDFADHHLFSLVAWDHVSWPGNDFLEGVRATDDGVKAAASNLMSLLTGIQGGYQADSHRYQPPAGYQNWAAVVRRERCQLNLVGRLNVLGT